VRCPGQSICSSAIPLLSRFVLIDPRQQSCRVHYPLQPGPDTGAVACAGLLINHPPAWVTIRYPGNYRELSCPGNKRPARMLRAKRRQAKQITAMSRHVRCSLPTRCIQSAQSFPEMDRAAYCRPICRTCGNCPITWTNSPNQRPGPKEPFVGASAFAHKGGLHANAAQEVVRSYEHIDPATVGNRTRVLVSDMAGRSSVGHEGARTRF